MNPSQISKTKFCCAYQAEEEKEPVEAVQEVSSAFVTDLEEAVAAYASKWAERDEGLNFSQRHDPELVQDEVRPLVFEDLRAEVDEEMKILLLNLKVSSLTSWN